MPDLSNHWEEACGGALRFHRRLSFDGLEPASAAAWIEAQISALDPLTPAVDPQQRYAADQQALAAWLGQTPGDILAMSALPADPHPGGGPPHLIHTTGGHRLVFKARSLAPESLFAEIVHWLNTRGADLRAAPALDRGACGWQAWVDRGDSAAGVDSRLRGSRAGALLALAWLLGLRDLHRENVVLDREGYPVPVDLEAMALPPFPSIDGEPPGSPLSSADLPTPGAVLETGLLDFWLPGIEMRGNQAGLRFTDPAEVEAAQTGFLSLCELIVTHRADFLGAFLPRIAALRPRLVMRHTAHYLRMLNSAAQAPPLERALLLDGWLSRAYTQRDSPPAQWTLHRVEWSALMQGMVPRLDLPADPEGLQRRAESLERGATGAQLRLIREAALWTIEEAPGRTRVLPAPERRFTAGSGAGDEGLLPEAQRIAAEIAQRHATEGALIARAFDPHSGTLRLRRIGWGLYDGAAGVALFLHSVDQHTGRMAHTALIADLLADLRAALRDAPRAQRLAARLPLGLEGLGGLIYAFHRMGDSDSAARVASLIAPERIATDLALDWQHGAAGAIAGLLALGDLARACACGDHLLACAIETEPGRLCWLTLRGQPHTGFSHGAAGISAALARLARHSGDPGYAAAARAAIAYENSLYNGDARNWPDRRKPGRFGQSWCHGAPGIALARLAVNRALDWNSHPRDIQAGLALVNAAPPGLPDHLCCGYAGHADLLIEAGQPEAARRRMADLIAAREAGGEYQLYAGRPRSFWSPLLFQGTAGIGYECLRALDPAAHPSLLLMECAEV